MWGSLGESTYAPDAARVRNNSQPALGFSLPMYSVGYLTDCPVGCSLSTNSAASSPHQLRPTTSVHATLAGLGQQISRISRAQYLPFGRVKLSRADDPLQLRRQPYSHLDIDCALTAVLPLRQG
jgi:hypothetical protein